jgi:hypothetical protein
LGGGRTTYKVIWELEAKDVWQVDDGLVFRVIDFGSSDISLDAIDLFIRPLSGRGVGILKSKTDKIRRYEDFTLGCALVANACK